MLEATQEAVRLNMGILDDEEDEGTVNLGTRFPIAIIERLDWIQQYEEKRGKDWTRSKLIAKFLRYGIQQYERERNVQVGRVPYKGEKR